MQFALFAALHYPYGIASLRVSQRRSGALRNSQLSHAPLINQQPSTNNHQLPTTHYLQ
ncbi:hypothetical protein H6G17_19375 [Chroococcidiopsis sp. FACHB-1243]|uniref:hypothetical protein n=1 Tax=Chroococcidiopsis sp. [FACHB-1243] TaxID=2692781 RepID=UPI001784491F|nr:hypothetical protein [Chroococcidiopsis sp. [FACHB-1243]]MBD2307631.1 hypothetical protein [Chroococcidiopsis sp. [FACHB-1243]]